MTIQDMSSASRAKKISLFLVAILAGAFLIFFAVTNLINPMGSKTGGTAPGSSGMNSLGLPNFAGTKSYSLDSLAGEESSNNTAGEITDRKVIKNGSLELLVKSAEETAKNIQGVAERLGGFTAGVDIYNVAQDAKSGRVTIRIPADKFNVAFDEIKKLAIKVERENSSAQDVTEQYIDLESLLKNLKAQESQYLEIMKKAETIEDILNVSSRLSGVRGQIEQIEGQLKYLANQIDLASITASLTEEGDVEVFGINWRPLYVAKQALRSLISGLASYVDSMIKFVFQLPVILLWLVTIGLIALAGWRILYWIWKKINNS
ncbi:MAG: DUF4349 domain-containing protein [Patescibacteria group bacterium]